MRLDHVTLVTHDVEALRAFFVDIVGLSTGPRPAFRVDGHWLYLDNRPAIHLVHTGMACAIAGTVPRVDHFAIRVDDPHAWQALIGRLRERQISFQTADVPLTGERQLFVRLAPAVTVEFVASARPA
jgi:catechol 2,3-dioxygenase-like lactoylglutathione lyase family enzyme